MYDTFFAKAARQRSSAVCYNDRWYFIGSPGAPSDDSLMQFVDGRVIHFPLASSVPVADLERSDALANHIEVDRIQTQFITDNLDHDGDEMFRFTNRFAVLRFIVDEIFPNMVAAPLEDRIDSIVGGKAKPKSGKEIILEALGDQTRTSRKTIEVHSHIIERLENQMRRRRSIGPYRDFHDVSDLIPKTTIDEPSWLSQTFGKRPFLMLRGKVYTLSRDANDSDLKVKIGRKAFGYQNFPHGVAKIDEHYQEIIAHHVKVDAIGRLREHVKTMDDILVNDVEYMPLMEFDEFSFRDIGFFRNGNVYYVFKRIPKFARQTTYDDNLFAAKEYDEEGYAGDLCIGLKVQAGKVRYLGYHEMDGGVVYRGPIKEDAPFHSEVEIVDPTMRVKYGTYRTICHVGGYPPFPLSADGFVQFMAYATSNFLDSFRQRFIDQHFDAEQQARLLDSGRLLRKADAKAAGYMLTNIHEIEKTQRRTP